MEIYDLDRYELSEKNGLYGGLAGSKEGIVIDGSNWLVKYPKSTSGMARVDISYTTSPLSEYLGSHVFSILGYNTHETILGIRNKKLVVACRDFTDRNTALAEIRTIKNFFNFALSERLGIELDETGSQHFVDLDTLMIHIRNNPILTEISGIESFFFEQAVIDVFINNSDRNNGNWGILRHFDGSPDTLAPIFDNGGSFQDKISDQKAERLLQNREQTARYACGTQTVYARETQLFSAKRFLELSDEYPLLEEAILKLVPKIEEKLVEIEEMILDVPDTAKDSQGKEYVVCGPHIKELFCFQLESRLQNLLIPRYQEILQKRERTENDIKNRKR